MRYCKLRAVLRGVNRQGKLRLEQLLCRLRGYTVLRSQLFLKSGRQINQRDAKKGIIEVGVGIADTRADRGRSFIIPGHR